MREQLKKLFAEQHKELKSFQVANCVNKYTDAVMNEISAQWATVTTDDIEKGEFSFGAEAVAAESGQTKRQTNYKLMQASPSTSLILVAYKGNNKAKRVSKVTFNPKFKAEIFKELIASDYVPTQTYLDELDKNANYTINIDFDALQSYIKRTRQALENSPSFAYTAKLYRNLTAATQINQRAIVESNGGYLVNEYWTEIDSGRIHGHGLSLQRVAKEVRHAALGQCWKIDFKASSYAIMSSLALQINPNIKIEALKHYIKYRSSVRKRIANQIGAREEQIKTIFTAMGFGADLKNNPFSSIKKMLGDEKFNLLIVNEEFAYIKLALDEVRNTILKCSEYKDDVLKIDGRKYNTLDSNGKKRNKNQKLAWIYQAQERKALDLVINSMPQDYEMLLPVHDCLYIKQQLPAQASTDLKYLLREQFELLDFEQEKVTPIQAAAENYDVEHSLSIAEEERNAVGYKSVLTQL